MQVGDYMTGMPLVTVSEQTSMKEAVPIFRKYRIRHLPVTKGSKLVGMVTDGDIRRSSPGLLSGVSREDYEQVMVNTPMSRIMIKEPISVTEETPLVDAVRMIVEKKFGALPVVNGEDLVGIFTEIDALKVLLKKLD